MPGAFDAKTLAQVLALSIAACANTISVAPDAASSSTAPSAVAPIAPAEPRPSVAEVASSDRPHDVAAPAPASTAVGAGEAEEAIFEPRDRAEASSRCSRVSPDAERVRCLLALRYAPDPAASALALDLFDATGDVVGTHPDMPFDGGYRGQLHLVPALARGPERRHLAWIASAARDFDAFFTALRARAPHEVRYRHRDLVFRVFRSEHARTPSAYASGWTIGYNVAGSLNTSVDEVRETLFHEIFHLNDQAHGDWSERALGAIYDAVVTRCGAKTACLAPYAPGTTMVRNGTYYAFQPGNGVAEYAAELSLRYYREARRALGQGPRGPAPRSFACGPEENARAYRAMVDELFGGFDPTDCR